jgi:hybrid cluster-associated redox disulfide protein
LEHPEIAADLTVPDLLARRPETVDVFFRHHMACVECVMAPFENVSEVAANCGLPCGRLLEELRRAAAIASGDLSFAV